MNIESSGGNTQSLAKALGCFSRTNDVHRYLQPLLERIECGELQPHTIISHRIGIDEAPDAYAMFNERADSASR